MCKAWSKYYVREYCVCFLGCDPANHMFVLGTLFSSAKQLGLKDGLSFPLYLSHAQN